MSLFSINKSATRLNDRTIEVHVSESGGKRRSAKGSLAKAEGSSKKTNSQRRVRKRATGGEPKKTTKSMASPKREKDPCSTCAESAPKPAARKKSSARATNRKAPTRSATAKRDSGSKPADRSHSSSARSMSTGSLFRIKRDPLRRIGTPTFLSDRLPTTEELAFVNALNTKFKGLHSELGAHFRAYCGGASGFVVRRFALSCAASEVEDTLSKYKPIGMGPKGLDKYFQKHYDMSWDSFLKTPSDELRKKLQATSGEKSDKTPARRRRAAKPAESAATATPAKVKRAKVAPQGAAEPSSAPKKATTEKNPRPAPKAKTEAPKRMPKQSGAENADLDRAEKEMAELKELLQKALK